MNHPEYYIIHNNDIAKSVIDYYDDPTSKLPTLGVPLSILLDYAEVVRGKKATNITFPQGVNRAVAEYLIAELRKNRENKMSKTNKTNQTNTRNSKRVNAAPVVADETVTLVSPRGKAYEVSNLSAFARRFNLDRSALSKVVRGERAQHKNWTRGA